MFVIGTAGHVDHGKSTLVKALTGIDPDRLEEERRREMTIDLGFAWLTLPSGREISMIDVPGHERFIKNMLAGVGGIDAALLIIAADESVMPQTNEHLAILDLLEVRHGLVVITKADLVEPEWLPLVIEEVQTFLQPTVLANAPVLPVSARSGAGLPKLLAAIDQMLDQTPSRSSNLGQPRLPIDRAFTVGGFGTVVTGTLSDGPLQIGDELELQPGGLRARVRGLQTHQQKVPQAFPGTRVAVNLAGISHHQIRRGQVLARPGAIQPSTMLDVYARVVAHAERPLEQNIALELFVGAAESPCRATLLASEAIHPGESGWLQLRLEQPIAVVRGDRYILRLPSPGQTIAGGRVVNPHPARHRRFRAEVINALEALARGTPADLLRQALADGLPHPWADVRQSSGLTEALLQEGLDQLVHTGEAHALQSSQWLISQTGWANLCEKLTNSVASYHRRYPLRASMPREELRSRLRLGAAAYEIVMAAASSAGVITLREAGAALPDFQPTLALPQQREVHRWLQAVAATPYTPPAPELEPDVIGWLIEQQQVVKISEDLFFLPETYQELLQWVRTTIQQQGRVTVAQLRDRFGTSRKYALALLEHWDERKITRRVGDERVLY